MQKGSRIYLSSLIFPRILGNNTGISWNLPGNPRFARSPGLYRNIYTPGSSRNIYSYYKMSHTYVECTHVNCNTLYHMLSRRGLCMGPRLYEQRVIMVLYELCHTNFPVVIVFYMYSVHLQTYTYITHTYTYCNYWPIGSSGPGVVEGRKGTNEGALLAQW